MSSVLTKNKSLSPPCKKSLVRPSVTVLVVVTESFPSPLSIRHECRVTEFPSVAVCIEPGLTGLSKKDTLVPLPKLGLSKMTSLSRAFVNQPSHKLKFTPS